MKARGKRVARRPWTGRIKLGSTESAKYLAFKLLLSFRAVETTRGDALLPLRACRRLLYSAPLALLGVNV